MKALYGDPIFIPENATPEELEELRLKVEKELESLYSKLVRDFKKL